MDSSQVEAFAVDYYHRLKLDPERPVDVFRIARLRFGPQAIERGTSLAGVRAKLFWSQGQRRIAVNRKLSLPYAQHAVGHELGHDFFDELGISNDDEIERLCDTFGAALMAPIPAVRAMLRAFGRDHEAIADEVCSTQTWAAMRIAETLGIPRAIITPQRVYARGPEEFVWGPEDELRRLVRTPRRGIVRAKLTDDPRRMLIDVDETG